MRKRKDDDDGTETGRDEMDDLWQAKTVIKPDDQLQLTEQASDPLGRVFVVLRLARLVLLLVARLGSSERGVSIRENQEKKIILRQHFFAGVEGGIHEDSDCQQSACAPEHCAL